MKNNFIKLRQLLEKFSKFIDNTLANAKNIKIISFVITVLIFLIIALSDGITSVFDVGYRSGIVLSDIPVAVQSDAQTYEITGLPNKVDASLVGDLPELQDIVSKRSLQVGVDLTTLSEGTHAVKLIATGATENVKVSLNPSVVNVVIRRKVTKKYAFKYDFINVNTEEDLSLDPPKFDFDKVEIHASEFNHEKIKFVSAIVNVKKATANVQADVSFVAYDEKGVKLDVSIHPQSSVVAVGISKPKKEVPIKIRTTGQLKDTTKAIESIDISESTTTIFGSTESLKNIQFAEVVIPLDQISGNDKLQLPIVTSSEITNSSISRVNVTITLGERISKVIKDVPITLKDMPLGYSVDLLEKSMDVVVEGTNSQVNKLTSESIVIYPKIINFGVQEVEANLEIEKPVVIEAILKKPTVKLVIKKQ